MRLRCTSPAFLGGETLARSTATMPTLAAVLVTHPFRPRGEHGARDQTPSRPGHPMSAPIPRRVEYGPTRPEQVVSTITRSSAGYCSAQSLQMRRLQRKNRAGGFGMNKSDHLPLPAIASAGPAANDAHSLQRLQRLTVRALKNQAAHVPLFHPGKPARGMALRPAYRLARFDDSNVRA
jgi:hypothetical protein